MTQEFTDVLFRKWRGEVIALFPGLAGTVHPSTCLSYMHVGQHGSADYAELVSASRPATPEEYSTLLNELAAIGYTLRVLRRASHSHYLARCKQIEEASL